MSQKCINPHCRNETNNKDGVCSGCRIEQAWQEHKPLLDTSNPPKGGSGVPSLIKEAEEVKDMAAKKPCTKEGCTSPAQKDGLCYKHFKSEHGVAPYPGMDKKKGKEQRAKSKEQRAKSKEQRDLPLPGNSLLRAA